MFERSEISLLEARATKLSNLSKAKLVLGGYSEREFSEIVPGPMTMMKFRWIIPSIICVFVVVALSLLFSKSYITFSKETGKMLVQRWSAGIPRGTVEVPLDQIKYVTVENFSGARTMTVVLTNGDTVRLGNFTDQGGEFGAVDTINGFLGRSRIKP